MINDRRGGRFRPVPPGDCICMKSTALAFPIALTVGETVYPAFATIYAMIRSHLAISCVCFLSAADCAYSQSNAFGLFDTEWPAVPAA